MFRMRAARALVTAELAWTASLVVAAYFASHAELGSAAHALSALEYAAARFICHQRPERSFAIWGTQLPVCARCTGIYVGGACAAISGTRRIGRPAMVLAFAATPAAVSILYEWTTGITPSNLIRGVTGIIAGFAVMAVLLWELQGEPAEDARGRVR